MHSMLKYSTYISFVVVDSYLKWLHVELNSLFILKYISRIYTNRTTETIVNPKNSNNCDEKRKIYCCQSCTKPGIWEKSDRKVTMPCKQSALNVHSLYQIGR